MFKPGASDEKAALAFDDMASALDAGLPLESLGGNAALGDQVLLDMSWQRGIKLKPTEKTVLESGWKSGNAAACLRGRAESRRRRAEFHREIWAGLRYPLGLLAMLPLAAAATYAIVGPSFAIGLAITYAIIAVVILVLARKLGRGDASLERYPIIGPLLEDVRELPYLESLHSLYGAGVPIVDAHRQAVQAVRMHGLQERLIMAQKLLEDGAPLRESLHSSNALSPETRSLLATGEQAGQLEDALQRALTRRQDVAGRKLALAAKRVGQLAYGLAVIGVTIILFKFYASYFAMIGGL
ncbi:MAG: type II secretory pathway component PulF [Planctomycetota bacterium]|jgi:type II secretory pathway component PulF